MRLKQLQKEQSDVEKLAKEVEKAELELAEERTREAAAQRMYEEGERQREERKKGNARQTKKRRSEGRKESPKEGGTSCRKTWFEGRSKGSGRARSAMSMSGGLKPPSLWKLQVVNLTTMTAKALARLVASRSLVLYQTLRHSKRKRRQWKNSVRTKRKSKSVGLNRKKCGRL